jgi:HEAT repeat protein
LTAILKNDAEEKEVRSQAALALGQIGAESAIPLLIETLRNKDSAGMVLWHCADALGYFHDSTAIDALIDALIDDYFGIKNSSDIRDATRDALVAIGDEYTVRRLLEKLSTQMINPGDYVNESICLDIILALGQIQNPLAIGSLLQFAQDTSNTYLQEGAIDMLANFDDPRIAPVLQALLTSPDEDVCKSAERAIEKIERREV